MEFLKLFSTSEKIDILKKSGYQLEKVETFVSFHTYQGFVTEPTSTVIFYKDSPDKNILKSGKFIIDKTYGLDVMFELELGKKIKSLLINSFENGS